MIAVPSIDALGKMLNGARQMSNRRAFRVRFGAFTLRWDGEAKCEDLRRGAEPVAIGPKTLELLSRFVLRALTAKTDGTVGPPTIASEELFDALWPGNAERSNLAHQIARLNRVLDDSDYVKSVGKGFYCLAREVQPEVATRKGIVGRRRELSRILGLWSKTPLQHVALYGPVSSGKTSLLRHLQESIAATPARVVSVNFRDPRVRSRAALLAHLLQGVAAPTDGLEGKGDLERFTVQMLEHVKGPTFVLCDDLDYAIESPTLDDELWNCLRALAEDREMAGRLAFAITSRDLPELVAKRKGLGSPFFGLFAHAYALGPLTVDEARELATMIEPGLDPADVDWIVTTSGRWPILIRLLCEERQMTGVNPLTPEQWKDAGRAAVRRFPQLMGADAT